MSHLSMHRDEGMPRIDALGEREVRVYRLETGDREQVRSATRYILARLAGVRISLLAFDYGPKGKPYCRTDAALHFSVSHAESVSLIAVTRVADVGVDIEAVRDVPRASAIARRFFPPEQLDAIFQAHNSHEQFARAWTSAEATVKVRGASIWEAGTPDPSVMVRDVTAPDGYVATVAVASEAWELVERALDLSILAHV